VLYYPYTEVLIQVDPEIKQIILSEEPIRGKLVCNLNHKLAGEDIYFSLGNSSFNYRLKSDLANFDKILLANTLVDIVIQN
jgi:Mor family transcriptional regulator